MTSPLQNGNINGYKTVLVRLKSDLEGQKGSSVWKRQGQRD